MSREWVRHAIFGLVLVGVIAFQRFDARHDLNPLTFSFVAVPLHGLLGWLYAINTRLSF